ncbi:hypothetical protein ACJJTC_018658 [Scirpophaga incertulas]
MDEDVKNIDPNTKFFTAYMQKVILMPKLTVKECFFSRKLVLFNETFVSPGKNQPAYCILWHEGESGRNAYNVASAKFSKLNIKTIRIVYLEPGHTYMAADAVHANISMKLAQNKNIYDKNDFTQKIKESRKNLDVLEITHQDMIIFKDDFKRVFPKEFKITSLKIVEFRKGFQSIFLKKSYDDETFKEFPALKPEVQTLFQEEKEDLFKSLKRETEPRGIRLAKKQELLKLCPCMPASRRRFFENLTVNENAKDLDNVV